MYIEKRIRIRTDRQAKMRMLFFSGECVFLLFYLPVFKLISYMPSGVDLTDHHAILFLSGMAFVLGTTQLIETIGKYLKKKDRIVTEYYFKRGKKNDMA
jgi:hypothetical protein